MDELVGVEEFFSASAIQRRMEHLFATDQLVRIGNNVHVRIPQRYVVADSEHCYKSGCPILSEGPQRDDL